MRKIKTYYLFAILCSTLLAGCGNGKKHFTDSDMSFRKNGEYAYKDGKVYTGDVWTSDDESIRAEYNKGKITHAEFYLDGVKIREKIPRDRTVFYNKSGEEITSSEFDQLYPDFRESLEAFEGEIKANEIEED